MLKVVTLIGTRPELIKMSRVIAELDSHTEHTLVHSGQNYDYELNQIFFDELRIRKPDYFLDISKDSAAKAIADVISKFDELLENISPDAVMIYGDTNTCLAVISAKRRKIPVFHMEAGNRCFDQRVPEELNRKVVDHLSDVNMVLTDHARNYLISEGLPPELIFKTGSHMYEVLNYYKDQIGSSSILSKLGVESQKYFVVSAHREENVDDSKRLLELVGSLEQLVEKYDYPIYFSTHPRTQERINRYLERKINPRINFIKPLGFIDYIKLQSLAFCVLSDSGTLTEESSILQFPGVMLRSMHERPEGMDRGVVVMAGVRSQSILSAVDLVSRQFFAEEKFTPSYDDYNNIDVSKQVVRILMSYVDYINANVWKVRV